MFGIGYKPASKSLGECYFHRNPGSLYSSVSTFWLLLLKVSSKSSCTLDAGPKGRKVQRIAHSIAWLCAVLNKVYGKRRQLKKKEKEHHLYRFQGINVHVQCSACKHSVCWHFFRLSIFPSAGQQLSSIPT